MKTISNEKSLLLTQLRQRIEAEYREYLQYALAQDKQMLIDNSDHICCVNWVYRMLMSTKFDLLEIQRMLAEANVLLAVSANFHFLCELNLPESMQESIDFIANYSDNRVDYRRMMDFTKARPAGRAAHAL